LKIKPKVKIQTNARHDKPHPDFFSGWGFYLRASERLISRLFRIA